MSEARFAARVTPKGELVFADEPAWRHTLKRWIGRDLMVTLALPKRIRSTRANRRYWGCTVRGVMGYLNPGREVPLSRDQVHYVLASAFLGCDQTSMGPVPSQTRTLTVEQFTEYMDRIEAHFTALGAIFPAEQDWGRDANGEHGTGGWEQ